MILFGKKINGIRFSRTKDGFAVYSELLNYEPIKWVIERIKLVGHQWKQRLEVSYLNS